MLSCTATSYNAQRAQVQTWSVVVPAGDGDEVIANSTGIDTNGVKGADVATPPGADTVKDPNGEGVLNFPETGCAARYMQQGCAVGCALSSVIPAVHASAGDGDEVLAPSEGIDTDGVKGADVATPPGADTVTDPNGATPLQQTSMCN
jgi:hypothetical protein